MRIWFADLVSHNHSGSFLEIYSQASLLITVVIAVCVIFLFIMPLLFVAGLVLALVSADFSLRGIEALQHTAPEVAAFSGLFPISLWQTQAGTARRLSLAIERCVTGCGL